VRENAPALGINSSEGWLVSNGIAPTITGLRIPAAFASERRRPSLLKLAVEHRAIGGGGKNG
jgi:hypothetical protein